MNLKYRLFTSLAIFTVGICLLIYLLEAASRSAVATAVAAPNQSADSPTPPNVILVLIDTLRSDHISAYGYERLTTPNLDSWVANEGALFLNTHTSAPWTCPSNAAVMTGRMPSTVGSTWKTIGQTVPPEEHTLAEYLHEAGYYTAGFTSHPYCIRGSIGFDQGFDYYYDGFAGAPPTSTLQAEELNQLITAWFDTEWTPVLSGTQPLFLLLYYFDPHTWYDPPAPYDTLYDPDYDGPLTPELFGHGETAKSGELVLSDQDLEHLLALYDGEIAYWDYQFGELLAYLDGLDLVENSLIVVTSDHGEMLGEHNEWSHAGSLYEEVLRVPFLVRYSGIVSAGLQISTPMQSMDALPTILDYVGITMPTNLDSVTLRPLLEGQVPTTTRPIFSEVDTITDTNHSLYWAAPPDSLRSMRVDDWKLIHGLSSGNDELYLLEPDSLYETENLAQQEVTQLWQLRFDLMNQFFPRRMHLPVMYRSQSLP